MIDTVIFAVTLVVPFAFGNSTFTPFETKVYRITKKISNRNTKSVMDDMLPVTLTLFRWPRFIARALPGCR